MNITTDRATAADHRSAGRINSDTAMLKNVVRQNWRGKLEELDKVRGRALAAEMDSHLASIAKMIDPLDYEIFCVPNMISHSKHLSRDEFSRYLRLMEVMAEGYSSIFGRELAGLAMIGISSKAKNAGGVERYHRSLSDHLESRISRYHLRIEKGKRRVDGVYMRIRAYERGILRLFRRTKIARLVKRMDYGMGRVESLNIRLDRLNGIYRKISIGNRKY